VCVNVHNDSTGQDVVVKINDRGPFVAGRIIDLSKVAAEKIGVAKSGTAKVRLDAIGPVGGDGTCVGSPGVSVWAQVRGFFSRLF
jgi:rare lipoprotein A